MPLSAEQKRDRRANATPEQRKDEAKRGKRRRAAQTDADKLLDYDRRRKRRTEIMAAAVEDNDAANESLDIAAARSHWYRLRVQHNAENDEDARAALQTKRDAKVGAARIARQEKAAAKKAEQLPRQRADAVAIAKAQVKYEARRQKADEAKQTRDAIEVRMRQRHASADAEDAVTKDWYAAQDAHSKAVRARVRAGYQRRALPYAPPHLVQQARDGATWATEPESSRSRILPSLVKQVPKPAPVRRTVGHAGYYERAIDMKACVQVGRKAAPKQGGVMRPTYPCAWQRAQEMVFEQEWCCDVAGEGCCRASNQCPEPPRPYNVWACAECAERPFTACDACHAKAEHPHELRLYRMMPWADAGGSHWSRTVEDRLEWRKIIEGKRSV